MKSKMKILVAFLLLGSSLFSLSADDRSFTYQTYAQRNFDGWPAIIEKQEQLAESAPTEANYVELLANCYGYVGHLLDTHQKEQAAVWAKTGMNIVKEAKKKYPESASVMAFESMFIAFQIAITPLKAPFQASSMMSTAAKALKLAPDLYLANLAQANIYFYFPEALGGDKKKAIELYRKVYQYFVDHPQIAANSWMYLNVMTTLSVANDAVGNKVEAKKWLDTALAVEPNFVYAKTILKPRLEGKQNK
ncbi:MAG: hypothetical protein RR202_07020 [Bacteroidales bacterium]